jgi:hypothetical protein
MLKHGQLSKNSITPNSADALLLQTKLVPVKKKLPATARSEAAAIEAVTVRSEAAAIEVPIEAAIEADAEMTEADATAAGNSSVLP